MATKVLLPWLCCLPLLLSAAMADYESDYRECAPMLMTLTVCQQYVSKQANQPTSDCCRSLQTVMNKNRRCLCVLIRYRNEKEVKPYNIDVTRAKALPGVCKVVSNITECPTLLNLLPNSPEAQDFLLTNASSGVASPMNKSGASGRRNHSTLEVLRAIFVASIMAILVR